MKRFIVFKLSLLVAAMALVQMEGYTSCLDKERMGLLEIKAFFQSEDVLHSWVDDRMSDCCGWERVKCNATTGEVTQLSLAEVRGHATESSLNEIPVVNLSLFLPFEQLQSLDLSGNLIHGFHDNQAYNDSFGSTLKQLKILDLRENHFNRSIVPYLASLHSLTTLILRANNFESSESMQGLSHLTNLKTLDLSYNAMRGSLKNLGLIWKLKNLIQLDLRGNYFDGHLPQCLTSLTHLEFLDLSDNKLSGTPSVISKLTSLRYLSLMRNNFEGLFSFSSLANHSKLEVFTLSTKSNMLFVETGKFLLPSQLKVLYLCNCNLRTIPNFLLYQHDLQYIDFSHNKLVGNFPPWLLQNNTKLAVLVLVNNSFTGTLQLPNFKHDLFSLDISDNNFSGQLPKGLGMILPKLLYINMSVNNFQGKIPSSMGEINELKTLDFSNNGFSGELPIHFLNGCISLSYLDLSSNSFKGQIFPNYMNLTQLWFLNLDNNFFTGKIGDGLYRSIAHVQQLQMSENRLSGQIPHWFGNFSRLQVLSMSKNYLGGKFPMQLNNLKCLEILDISGNRFSGSIPYSFNLSSVRHLFMQKNAFNGSIPSSLFTSTELVCLNLRDNKFSGSIPHDWINKQSILHVLLLGRNLLQGHIPIQLCQLRNLTIMDLSYNRLNGSIPSCFSEMLFWTASILDNIEHYILGYVHLDYEWYFTFNGAHFNSTALGFGLHRELLSPITYDPVEKVEFVTKNRFESYEGDILRYMTGLDLSSNELCGDIPFEIGELRQIRALNLSHNSLSGSISESFSNLSTIESLDLSHNKLSGQIPLRLTELYNLEIFNVSYNDLSGPTPNEGQFGTFDENNYKGNPNLCGPQVMNKSCTNAPTQPSSPSNEGKGEAAIDMVAFYWSFAASYVIFLLGLFSVLWINLYWRMLWFRFIDHVFICYCIYFVSLTNGSTYGFH